MELIREPFSPWEQIATGLAIGITITLCLLFIFRRTNRLGQHPITRIAILVSACSAVISFACAVWNPILLTNKDTQKNHLAVVVDVSDSVLRTEGGWDQVHRRVLTLIEGGVSAMSDLARNQARASITTFGAGIASPFDHDIALAELPEALRRLDRSSFAPGNASNLAVGLIAGSKRIDQSGGTGAILLISDGNQTEGDARKAAESLARRGIPIYVLPITSREPELAITAADLPRQVNSESETFLRGVIMNRRTDPVKTLFSISENTALKGTLDRPGASISATQVFALEPGAWAYFRTPLKFTGFGLQFADLSLKQEGATDQHFRRFYTQVIRPPRILAIGDSRWLEIMPPGVISATQMSAPQILPNLNWTDYDGIVISGAPANQFPAGSLANIARAVEQKSLGLMLINGSHQGADEKTATVLMSYAETPLDPLLPLSGRPRPFRSKRNAVIMIDSSGSMSGSRIEKAKAIARHIVQNLLQPQDRLDVLTFTTGASQLVSDQPMDEAGKQLAISRINSIGAGGGTDPTEALRQIAGRKLTDCSLIFISDGEFGAVNMRPECFTIAFASGQSSIPSTLANLAAKVYPTPDNFDPAQVTTIGAESKKFFEKGQYVAVAPNALGRKQDPLPIPNVPLEGTAVSYLKEEADLIAVRPKLADPVLAYMESKPGAGYVGAIATEVPATWRNDPQARAALAAWITRIVSYEARDRYDIRLADRGNLLTLQISLVAKENRTPDVNQLDGQVEIEGEVPIPVTFRPDDIARATFNGLLQVPRQSQARQGTLVLKEFGQAALARPQRIPIVIPPGADFQLTSSNEAYSYGLNETLLREIANIGGGMFNPPSDTPFFQRVAPPNRGIALWQGFLILGVVFYLIAIALVRLEV